MKRVLSIIIVFILLFSFCSFGVDAAPEDQKQIKILAIGNSYSNNSVKYISGIAASLGIKVSATSLYYAGCSLEQHVKFYNSDSREYEFYVDGINISTSQKNTMREVFELADYDYITLQQSPSPAARFSTYWTEENPWLTDLYKIVKKHQPNAKIMIHQTWSFCHEDATGNSPYMKGIVYRNSLEMFEKIESSYEKAAEKLSIDKETGIIPVGKAIQLAKDEYGYGDFYNGGSTTIKAQQESDALYKDNVDHINDRGSYLAACVWIEKIFGLDCRKATFRPGEILTEEDCVVLRQIAHETVTGEVNNVKENWRYLPSGDGVELVHYMGEIPADGVIAIPESVDGKTVNRVDDTAFKYITGVKKVVLPNLDIKYEEGTLDKITSVEDLRDDSILYPKKKNENAGKIVITAVIISAVVLLTLAIIGFVFIKRKKSGKSEK